MSWFVSDEQRDAYVAALREELAGYLRIGLRDRAEAVIEQLRLLGERDELTVGAAAKPVARKRTAVAVPAGATTRDVDGED